jgi:hypothetical protein
MSDALAEVLRLVANGDLTAAEAAPILDALNAADADDPAHEDRPSRGPETNPDSDGLAAPGTRGATAIRIEINEDGRRVVNLRVPVSLGRFALDRIPGLSGANVDLVRRALAEGRSGTLLHIDDEDGSVRIALE